MPRRRGRRLREYRRRNAIREPYDIVLIVCEGQKTEPAYFKGLCSTYRLSNTNIRVVPGDWGNDPLSIVKYAIREYEKSKDYDRVYCVFDRDGHANFQQALDYVSRSPLGRLGKLHTAHSIPCFELWVLMHFVYWTAPIQPAGNQSACDRALAEVRRFIPDYSKGFEGVYGNLENRLESAITHGQRLEEENRQTGSANPATELHKLVAYLRDLRSH